MPRVARAGDEPRLPRDARALHEQICPLQQRFLLVSQVDFDAEDTEPPERVVRREPLVPVVGDDARARLEQNLGSRLPGARETDDEDARAPERGLGAHPSTNWRKSR